MVQDHRASSVMGPHSNRMANYDSQLEKQRVYCSLGSSRNQTPDSKDQSYTILQMASSTNKMAINSNFQNKYMSIKSACDDGSDDNKLIQNRNMPIGNNQLLKANAFSLSQHRSNSNDQHQNVQMDNNLSQKRPIIINTEEDNVESILNLNHQKSVDQVNKQFKPAGINMAAGLDANGNPSFNELQDQQIKLQRSCPDKNQESKHSST